MKLITKISLLTTMVVAGCSSSSTNYKVGNSHSSASERLARTISSATSPEALENEYAQIAQDPEPAKSIDSYFERLVRIYYRSDSLIREYDVKLEEMYKNKDQYNGNDLITDPAYARVMSAWILRNRVVDKISYIYQRNYTQVFDKENTGNDNAQDHEKDEAIRNGFLAAIKRFGASERLAMQSLLQELNVVGLDIQDKTKKVEVLRDVNLFKEKVFSSYKEQKNYIQSQKTKSAKSSAYQALDPELEQEIAILQEDVSEHLKEMVTGREPQSAGEVVPSSSSKGNLTGNTFRTGRWALTYDDGPSATHTSKILDNLSAHGMKTSFFWLAQLTPSYPTLINRAKSLGMALGNHSFSHANLPKMSQARLNREINESTAVHTRMFGYKPTYFRCPYGACGGNGSNIRQMIANQGMVHIFWNIDSLDWQDKNPSSIVNRVTKAMAVAKKGIILFHDIHPQSVEATRLLMDSWTPQVRAGNMRLITIPQAIEELNSDAGMQ